MIEYIYIHPLQVIFLRFFIVVVVVLVVAHVAVQPPPSLKFLERSCGEKKSASLTNFAKGFQIFIPPNGHLAQSPP